MLGAYAGRLGIAIAAARVGAALGEERFAEHVLAVALDAGASADRRRTTS